MNELVEARAGQHLVAKAPAQPPAQTELTQAQKAAIIIGMLGAEAAGPVLEQMNEATLRSFATAMSSLRKVEPETVRATISEFRYELDRLEETVNGGLGKARELLQDYVPEATLTRILDEVGMPSSANVWKKLSVIDEQSMAEFLSKEHPQTAAVVLSKLPAEQAAKVLGRVDAERARDMVFGLTKAATLDPSVIEAIGHSVSEDFLANHRVGSADFKPAERIGSIMNYTTGDIRQAVLGFLDATQPDLSDAVKGSMFTFQDIQDRIERRDVATIVRTCEQDVLLRALKGAEDNGQETRDFILASMSSRMAEQLRETLGEMDRVKVREAEEAQHSVLKVIRELESAGELKLIAIDE